MLVLQDAEFGKMRFSYQILKRITLHIMGPHVSLRNINHSKLYAFSPPSFSNAKLYVKASVGTLRETKYAKVTLNN